MTPQVDIKQENLRFLIGGLERGKKGELADKMDVSRGILSEWQTDGRPREENLKKLAAYFGLPASVDLRRDPLFLGPYPIVEIQHRDWLHKRVDDLPGGELRELFPALRKLLDVL